MPMPRKSLEEHELQGTKPHYETTKVSHIAPGRPGPPRFLSADARKKFKQLAKVLEQRCVATDGDTELLTQYVILWERWMIAQQHVADEGSVVNVTCYSKNGDPYQRDKVNPWLQVAQTTEKQLAAALAALGLTVSNRDKAKQTALDKKREVVPGSIEDTNPEWLRPSVVPIQRPAAVDANEMKAGGEESDGDVSVG